MGLFQGNLVRLIDDQISTRASRTRINLAGVTLDAICERDCVEHIMRAIDSARGGWVATHNVDHMRRLALDPQFRTLCATASLRVADGMPLVWASRIAGSPLPQRVAGSSLIHTLTAAAAQHRRTIFFLGGNPQTAEAAAKTLLSRHPGFRLAGCACPMPGFEHDPVQIESIQRVLVHAAPDIVYVALGSPKQERLIVQLRDALPRAWFLGVGISFSFVCGQVQRAPRLIQRIGLEWLHRLAQEPRRLAGRYLVHDLPFACRLFAAAVSARLGRDTPDDPEIKLDELTPVKAD